MQNRTIRKVVVYIMLIIMLVSTLSFGLSMIM
ncbi:stressosome-associated protein Prli42 [Bacillus thermotolerans]|nr:stressosome-associated protein Prli42 [Bacillus thermotolerans]